ncbi:MAG TPA: hypothetical protein PKE47_17225, partial [Verrucomicrobiota bacterium]|nr:hypothetical protein [Verrucomicrobiota bacterium]
EVKEGAFLGYVRTGSAIVVSSDTRVPGPGCPAGFWRVEPRGYVCHDRTVSLDPPEAFRLAADATRAVFACAADTLADAPADTVPTDLHVWTADPPLLRRVGLPKPAPGDLYPANFTALTFTHEEADDGRHLLFLADRFRLVQDGATNWHPPAAWRLDLETGGLVRLAEESLAASGAPGAIRSIHGFAPSADAARIELNLAVFAADGSNLVETVRLWEGGELRTLEDFVLTVPPGGAPAPASLADAQLTPDGTRLLFLSKAPDVVPGAPGDDWELYVRDLSTGQTRALSAPDGNYHGGVNFPEIALGAGGRVAFVTGADGLVPGELI